MRIPTLSGPAALLGIGAIALTLAGCGSNGSLLSPGAATQLTAELSQASTALQSYNCTAAYSALANFRNDLGQLQGLNGDLAGSLNQGASTVESLANQRCPTSSPATPTTQTATATSAKHAATTAPVTATDPTTSSASTLSTASTDTQGGSTGSGGGSPSTGTSTGVTTVTVPASGGAGFGNGNGDGGDGG